MVVLVRVGKTCTNAMAAIALVAVLTAPGVARALELPPEVTPALRAACEGDVRRLCVRPDSTVSTVRACVERRFSELGMRCKMQIAASGLLPGKTAPAAGAQAATVGR